MKPYQSVPIVENQEPLVPIPLEQFAVESPHPYEKLGAPYGNRSPYFLRQEVLKRLLTAQASLQQQFPGWQIQIFDAYRPIAVQHFMVDYTFHQLIQSQGLETQNLTSDQCQMFLEQVYQFWAVPSSDPKTPPPHSTGAAVDITLVDHRGQPLEMGSAIDEISPRSAPNYFQTRLEPEEQRYHQHRQILYQVMQAAGFQQHPREWWHFSYGDQLWAWLIQQQDSQVVVNSQYGAID